MLSPVVKKVSHEMPASFVRTGPGAAGRFRDHVMLWFEPPEEDEEEENEDWTAKQRYQRRYEALSGVFSI